MKTMLAFLLAVSAGLCTVTSCSSTPPQPVVEPTSSALTPGMVKTKLLVGETTQAEVLEIFGPPDHVTKQGQVEMWGYDKVSREVVETATGKTSGFGAGLLGLVGGITSGEDGTALGGALPGVGGRSGSSSHQSQRVESTKTVFLLIYFDERDIVKDYKLSVTKF